MAVLGVMWDYGWYFYYYFYIVEGEEVDLIINLEEVVYIS